MGLIWFVVLLLPYVFAKDKCFTCPNQHLDHGCSPNLGSTLSSCNYAITAGYSNRCTAPKYKVTTNVFGEEVLRFDCLDVTSKTSGIQVGFLLKAGVAVAVDYKIANDINMISKLCLRCRSNGTWTSDQYYNSLILNNSTIIGAECVYLETIAPKLLASKTSMKLFPIIADREGSSKK